MIGVTCTRRQQREDLDGLLGFLLHERGYTGVVLELYPVFLLLLLLRARFQEEVYS